MIYMNLQVCQLEKLELIEGPIVRQNNWLELGWMTFKIGCQAK